MHVYLHELSACSNMRPLLFYLTTQRFLGFLNMIPPNLGMYHMHRTICFQLPYIAPYFLLPLSHCIQGHDSRRVAPSEIAQGCSYIAAEDAAAAATTAFAARGAAAAYGVMLCAASYVQSRSSDDMSHALACCLYMDLTNAEWSK